MAVCGLLSMFCVPPIQPDMDSCPSHSFGVTRNHLKFWQSGAEARASSCLSSTMVDHNDPDDSESSLPPTPSRTASESKQKSVTRDPSLAHHELELSISSLNDAQRNIPQSFRSIKEEYDLISASNPKDDTLGGSAGGEETSFPGPPRKRARMSPLGLRLDENPTANVREQLQRHSSLSASSDVTGVHGLMPSRSLPSFRSMEKEPSPSASRGGSGGSRPTTSWWLTPKSSPTSTEAQHSQSVQEASRSNFAVETRGMTPGTSLQERDFLFKEPSFFPNMLSSMEAEHVRRGEDVPHSAGSRPREQAGPPRDPPELPFFSRKESSTSRVSSSSTVSEETIPRSGPTFFLDKPPHEGSTVFGHHSQHAFEAGRRRHPPASESQHGGYEREHPQSVFTRSPVEQKTSQLPPGGNANTTFYARIRDVAQPPASNPFSQAGLAGPYNPSLGFNPAGQNLPHRGSPQIGVGPLHFGGEAGNPNLVQQQVNNEVLRNLLAGHPSIGSHPPPYMSQVQASDPHRLNFPSVNLSSLDFLQSLQRQQAFPQAIDRYSRPGQVIGSSSQQDFSRPGVPQASHQVLSAELNPSLPPRGSQAILPTSSGLREFLSPPGPSSSGQGRDPAIGMHVYRSAAELPTNLSLQAAEAPPPLTVVMEGRSIGRRIGLVEYDGYDSFAAAMRAIFESHVSSQEPRGQGEHCTLGNAIPGYVIAYEDEEGDVLLAGDLPWRDFVRVAKQIRLVSASKVSFRPPSGPFGS